MLEVFSCIGKGGFGTVQVGKWGNKMVAIKTVSKGGRQELDLLKAIKSPFVVRLFGAFEEEDKLHLVMQFCAGGDLFRRTMMMPTRMLPEHARFYLAQVGLVLKFLHRHGVLYGDLKLENLMIDSRGYLRLVDFGLSQRKVSHVTGAYGPRGSIYTAAPELRRGERTYGLAVDIWAFGCVAYELLTQQHFLSHEDMECKCVADPVAREFVTSLLKFEPGDRPRIDKVLDHAWFDSVDWTAIHLKTATAPWVPDADEAHFDDEFLDLPIEPMDFALCKRVL